MAHQHLGDAGDDGRVGIVAAGVEAYALPVASSIGRASRSARMSSILPGFRPSSTASTPVPPNPS
jgi:hypothetical protein